jgi:hypothetical protein
VSSANFIGKTKETSFALRWIDTQKPKNLFSATWKSFVCEKKTTLWKLLN